MKSPFPNQEWTDFALSEVRANGLENFSAADGQEFWIDGTAESWVFLLAAMAKHESNFDPDLTYNEGGNLSGVVSVGLLQMSYRSVRAYSKFGRNRKIQNEIASATTAKLKDPLFNLRVALVVLQRWVSVDGLIATSKNPWLGGARYWAVLRKGAPKVKATLRKLHLEGLTPIALKRGTTAKPRAQSIVLINNKSGGGADIGAHPAEINIAFQARQALGSSCNWIFEVDYSINSKYPRMFVYSIKDRTLFKYKCAHGNGGKNYKPHDGVTREVSNVPNSKCSSLGVIKTGARYDSDLVGEALRLHGLSPSNTNILARGVVLHGGNYVVDNDRSVSGRSHGCIVVDDQYIDREVGGALLEWLKDGSIGVAHFAGQFKLPN